MNQQIRDAFFDRLYEVAKKDSKIVIVTVDLGAPSLDKFREELPEQFINVGISEQNAILVGVGLAIRGKRVFVYGITEFITFRCFEQIKIYLSGMKIPVTVLGVGAGACFSCDGLTHQSLEQLSVLRTLPNLNIITCADRALINGIFNELLECSKPSILMLDKTYHEKLVSDTCCLSQGFRCKDANTHDVWIVSCGEMTYEAELLWTEYRAEIDMGIIDMFNMHINEDDFIRVINAAKYIITLEENVIYGGLGSYVLEILSDYNCCIPLKRFALNTFSGYEPSYNYPSRNNIRNGYGLRMEDVRVYMNSLVNNGEKM